MPKRAIGEYQLLNIIPDAVIFTDARRRCRFVNTAAAERTLGLPRAKAIGLPIETIVAHHPGIEAILAGVADIVDSPSVPERDVTLRLPGSKRCVLAVSHHRIALERRTAGVLTVARDVTAEREAVAKIERSSAEEQALGNLLHASLAQTPMEEYLEHAVDVLLTSVPWLELLPGGGVFLAEEDGLRLVARKRLHPALHTRCAYLKPGQCLCGAAAASRRIQHAECVDGRHTVRFDGMKPHGHYNVPILNGDTLTGVLVLYLPHGRKRVPSEQEFLSRVADVLAMGIHGRQIMEQQLDQVTYYDALTGLPNRALLRRQMDDRKQQLRPGAWGALLHLDLDRFNLINDALGHAIGDRALQRIAEQLQQEVQKRLTGPHVFARLGGDEFALWAPDLGADASSTSAHARELAEVMRETTEHATDANTEHTLSASIGIAVFNGTDVDTAEVLKQANSAMRHAKQSGSGSIAFHQQEMQARARKRLRLERELRTAVRGADLLLYYQPQTDAEGRLLGSETLIRWPHPTRGMVSPGEFIPVAEDSELIIEIGRWTQVEACRRICAWREQFAGTVCGVSVNVSAVEFHRQEFVATIKQTLDDSGVRPELLTLELTERIVMQDVQRVIERMHALRELGVRIALDDFGTGYSSLSYLRHLPLHELKIDQSFVRGIPDDDADIAIVEAILTMANRLGLDTVAEGVETEEQRAVLSAHGCDRHQGYLFSRPLPAAEFAATWLATAGSS